jgi:hypothetical protein
MSLFSYSNRLQCTGYPYIRTTQMRQIWTEARNDQVWMSHEHPWVMPLYHTKYEFYVCKLLAK